jgi:nitrite reductase/ring-hydroxylating ferredoxin subunit
MKNIFLIALTYFVLIACSKNDISNENCKFLLNIVVNTSVNLNLPQYSLLQFISNSVYMPNVGNKGIIVTNSGTGFLAWDAADPNHAQQSCSVVNGTGFEGTCGCTDANTYSFITGQSLGTALPCTLKRYRVEQSGNTLFISN